MSELAELIERFRRGAEVLAMATTGAAGAELDFTPGEGKWSVRTVVCHLYDAEIFGAARFRSIIAEDNPLFSTWNANLFAANLDYSRRKLSPVIETFRRLRGENHELLKELPEAAFARTGRHPDHGELSLLELLRNAVEHTEGHIMQLQAARAAYKEHKAKLAAAAATASVPPQ